MKARETREQRRRRRRAPVPTVFACHAMSLKTQYERMVQLVLTVKKRVLEKTQ